MKLIFLTVGLFVGTGSARTLERKAGTGNSILSLLEEHSGYPPSADVKSDPDGKVDPGSYESKDGHDDHSNDPYLHDDGHYHADRYDSRYNDDHHHQDHGSGYDIQKEDPYYATALFCRMVVYPSALNPDECANVKIEDYDPYFFYDDPREPEAKGKCYWDTHLGKIDQQSGCLCPRPKESCEKKYQCYWRALPNPGKHEDDKKSKHWSKSKDHKEDDYGHCIHNSERFYNLLAKLLKKRGKKDLSFQIEYSSAPAKEKLPHGPYGPAIIGGNLDHHGYQGPPLHGGHYPQNPPYLERPSPYPQIPQYHGHPYPPTPQYQGHHGGHQEYPPHQPPYQETSYTGYGESHEYFVGDFPEPGGYPQPHESGHDYEVHPVLQEYAEPICTYPVPQSAPYGHPWMGPYQSQPYPEQPPEAYVQPGLYSYYQPTPYNQPDSGNPPYAHVQGQPYPEQPPEAYVQPGPYSYQPTPYNQPDPGSPPYAHVQGQPYPEQPRGAYVRPEPYPHNPPTPYKSA